MRERTERRNETGGSGGGKPPKQAGEARDPWWWVERCVWTERMLTRLTSSESANRVWFSTDGQDLCARQSAKRL